MTISAPITSTIDIRLPNTPEFVADPAVYRELVLIYQAIRSLQASIIPQYTTANRPTYQAGLVIYDTTLSKLVVGGAAGWEVVTSV